MSDSSKYAQLGIDAGKEEVRGTFGQYIENQYPGAVVNIILDPRNPEYVMTQHMDGDGSKFVQRLLMYAETFDPTVIRGAVDDALQMNLGDIAASGFVFGPILITDVININGANVPKGVVMSELGYRFRELLELYRSYGFDIHFLGGETADLPTQVQSVAFDIAVSAHAKETDIIRGNIQPGDKIYGFASDGQAAWEERYNSGIMSNGLTLARVGTMWKGYSEQYPFLGMCQGRYKVGEKAEPPYDLLISDALISPTRQWSILIRNLLTKLKEAGMYEVIHGISMNTGGGITKIRHLGQGITYRKKMPTPPGIFQLVHEETGEEWRDMFRVFNCGVGVDIVGIDDPQFRDMLQQVSEETGVVLYELGECHSSDNENNHVVAETEYGTFEY